MNTSLSRDEDYTLVTLCPSYENVHALLAEIHVYVFGQDGKLIGSQPVRREKVSIALNDGALQGVTIVLAPPLENASGEALTLCAARGHPIFEAEMRFDDAQASYALPPVPEAVWRWWLVHSLWNNVREISRKKTGLLGW
ncbi:MAG: hypothetical protein ACKN9T_13115 [Candidatus Methylumidiphilus sp.]